MDKYELHKIISIEKYFENIKSGMRFYFQHVKKGKILNKLIFANENKIFNFNY